MDKRFWKKGVLIASVTIGLALLFTLVVAKPAEARGGSDITNAKVCSVRANPVDEGGGKFTNRNYFIYVYNVTNEDGYFIYYNIYSKSWRRIEWKSWGIDGSKIRFGVSTKWAYTYPLWKVSPWKYIYPC